MKLKIATSVIGIVALIGVSTVVCYGDTAAPKGKAKIVGNKICPVTGGKIEKKTEVTYEYKGKIYSFCCAACIPEFQKNPEKYIGKVK